MGKDVFSWFRMKHVLPILPVIWLLAGCEQVGDLQEEVFGEEIPEETPPPVDPPPEAPPPKQEIAPPEPERPPPVKPKPVIPPKPAGPVQPKASPELLRLVNNWRAIPASAFPRQVTVKREVKLVLRNTSGNSVGGSTYPPGSKLFAFEQVGNFLSVGPSVSSHMRTMVGLDETDLKMVLIYAYEMARYRRAQIASAPSPPSVPVAPVRTYVPPRPRSPTVARPAPASPRPLSASPRPVSGAKPTPKAKPTPRPGRQPRKSKENAPLFEDLPEPKDLGHGKWCVCKNCRTGRGAGKGGVLYPD